jgi:hypothetical protein
MLIQMMVTTCSRRTWRDKPEVGGVLMAATEDCYILKEGFLPVVLAQMIASPGDGKGYGL